jgi:hypothetical protein
MPLLVLETVHAPAPRAEHGQPKMPPRQARATLNFVTTCSALNQPFNAVEGPEARTQAMSSARRNISGDADFEAQPFASGAFRLVAKGRYTKGHRRGRLCVVKWFKQQHAGALEEDFFAADLAVVRKAQEAIDAWNAHGFISDTIYLNHPEVWRPVKGPHAGKRVLVEPWIPTFERYNSNTGLAADETGYWHEVMQALSHFSYHHSGGRLVLCDLQGGIQSQGGRPKQAVLTDPAILSLSKRYGSTDLGKEGIATFFHHHECTT